MGGGGPPPPPMPASGLPSGGGSRGGFLADIARGTTLKPAASRPAETPAPSGGGNALAAALQQALVANRKAIDGKEMDKADDWSDEEAWNDG